MTDEVDLEQLATQIIAAVTDSIGKEPAPIEWANADDLKEILGVEE